MSDRDTGPPPTRDLDPEEGDGEENRRSPIDRDRRRYLVAVGAVGAVGLAGGAWMLSSSDPGPPAATITFTFTLDSGDVAVSHDGGEAITRDNTGATGDCDVSALEIGYVDRDRTRATECWPAPVEAGDTVTVVPRRKTTVDVYWGSPDGTRRSEMASFRVP